MFQGIKCIINLIIYNLLCTAVMVVKFQVHAIASFGGFAVGFIYLYAPYMHPVNTLV